MAFCFLWKIDFFLVLRDEEISHAAGIDAAMLLKYFLSYQLKDFCVSI